jgi:hypothetical protein
LTPAAPIATFMQELSDKKALHADQLAVALPNLACYLSCLQYEQVSYKECCHNSRERLKTCFFISVKNMTTEYCLVFYNDLSVNTKNMNRYF